MERCVFSHIKQLTFRKLKLMKDSCEYTSPTQTHTYTVLGLCSTLYHNVDRPLAPKAAFCVKEHHHQKAASAPHSLVQLSSTPLKKMKTDALQTPPTLRAMFYTFSLQRPPVLRNISCKWLRKNGCALKIRVRPSVRNRSFVLTHWDLMHNKSAKICNFDVNILIMLGKMLKSDQTHTHT